MMRQLAILPVYSPLKWSTSDLDNFKLVPYPNHCELIQKSPKKFGWPETKPRYSPDIDLEFRVLK